jgi:GNAT superfamily N-acetyltransferase
LFLLGHDYERLAPLLAGALFDQRVGHQTVWTVDDCSAVAMWDRPGAHLAEDHNSAWAGFHAAADPVANERLALYDAAFEAVAPADPFWYLGVLATRPDRQGEGLASAVIAPGCARADADGLAACLETSTTANRAFYGRRGFTQATQVVLEGGPPSWWLCRPPAGNGG